MIELRWRATRSGPTLRWRGPAGMAEALRRPRTAAAAAIIGPPGRKGDAGDVSAAQLAAEAAARAAADLDLDDRLDAAEELLGDPGDLNLAFENALI